MFSFLDVRDKTSVVAKRMKYLTNNGEPLESQLDFKSCHFMSHLNYLVV